MKISKINVYQVDLPLKEAAYNWADGKGVAVFDTTVVEIQTDAGITGYGEVCPLGSNYLPSYANGVRTGIRELGPQLIGQNPMELEHLNHVMDYHLKGHPYVKSSIDMACWDIAGKQSGRPLHSLLGGKFGETVTLYRAISQLPPSEMAKNVQKYREEGYTKFQLKLGGAIGKDIERCKEVRKVLDPSDVLVGDANTGWLSHEAIVLCNELQNTDIYIEQPCATYEECLRVRQNTNKPFILDENIDSLENVLRAHSDRAADVVNLKISKLGGITKTKLARDVCVSVGLAMTMEDTWGSDITTSAIAHLAHSTPEKYRFSSTDFNSYHTVHIAGGAPCKKNGAMKASDEPGLGIQPYMDVLGTPVLTI